MRPPTPELPLSTTQLDTGTSVASDPAAPVPTPTPPKTYSVNVEQAVQRVARSSAVAAVVVDRETGDTLVSENADRPFNAGSLVKLLIALDALESDPDNDMLRKRVFLMIRLSDDPIASSLWASEGGTSIIERMSDRLGLSHTRPPARPGQWGDTEISANDLVKIYDYLLTEAPEADRATILDAMAATTPSGTDGFKQHFGIPSGIGKPWAVKQAWTNNPQNKSAHSTGFVGAKSRYIVVLLTEYPLNVPWPFATMGVTEAATAVAPLVK